MRKNQGYTVLPPPQTKLASVAVDTQVGTVLPPNLKLLGPIVWPEEFKHN